MSVGESLGASPVVLSAEFVTGTLDGPVSLIEELLAVCSGRLSRLVDKSFWVLDRLLC